VGDITVDDKAIADLGTKIIALKDQLDPAIKGLDGINIQAGAFPDADELKTTVDERKGEAVQYLTAVGEQLVSDGEKLKETATLYAETEKDNTILAEDVVPKQ
jgi:hypothetical protein